MHATSARVTVAATTTLVVAAVAFIVLTAAAMLVYPGGSFADPHSAGYRFFGNFFSDLGQTFVVYGHENPPNTLGCVLFVVALCGIAGALAWAALPIGETICSGRTPGAIAIGIAGWVSALGFVGVAANPWNLRFTIHMWFVKVAFGALFFFMLFVASEQFRNSWPLRDSAVGAVYALALAAYFANLLTASLETPQEVMLQSVLQKGIVYLSVICLSLIGWSVRTRVQRWERVSS